ncbi:MAG: ATP-binding cassette domain-containing protein [Rhodobacteraceae bacterium]|nr:MAG: ATP-binding cassette domain-containing protein [Paracoccaceae bacterium]
MRDAAPARPDPRPGPSSPERPAAIACRGLWKVYGPKAEKVAREGVDAPGHVTAVRNVSLSVARGEMLVVMGLSGSGKSTLLRCLARLVEPTAGDLRIDGVDIRALDERGLVRLRREKMGMVFQSFALLPNRTVLDNVAFPLEMRGAPAAARYARAREMVRLVGLAGREDHYPRELSGGQQQRVGIARSLAIEPDIWFLDEPFSALDPLIRREMQDEFLKLKGMLHKTIVFVTHDFDEALRLADRIAVMHDGRVEQADTPDRVLLAPATDYVASFTRDVPKARVVRAATLAEAAPPTPDAPAAAASATIAGIARMLVETTAERLPVIDEAGRVLGSLSRARALDLLFEDDRR